MEYAQIAALNWSALREMAASPRHYLWRKEHPREDTPSMRLGRAIHCAVLEPGEYDARYLVRPADLDGRTIEGRAWLLEAAERGVDVLTTAENDTVASCAAAVLEHSDARVLVDGTVHEVVVEWTADGVRAKGRLDGVASHALIDLKTTRSLADVPRSTANYLYHGQLAWYQHGAREAGHIDAEAEVYLVAVETAPPYDVGVYRLPMPLRAEGERLWRRLLGEWIECHRTDRWPGRCPGVTDLDLPRWGWTEGGLSEEW